MAVAFNSGSLISVGSGTSTSPVLTVGAGANRALIAYVTLFGTTSGVTAVWDSGGTNQSMTLIDSFTNTTDFPGVQSVLLFGLAAPTSGNKTLLVSWTGTANFGVGYADFTGANQVGGTSTFANAVHAQDITGSSTTATSTITSATGNLVTAQYITISAADSVSDSQLWLNTLVALESSANYKAGAASVSLTADLTGSGGTKWMSQGVSIQVPGVIVLVSGGMGFDKQPSRLANRPDSFFSNPPMPITQVAPANAHQHPFYHPKPRLNNVSETQFNLPPFPTIQIFPNLITRYAPLDSQPARLKNFTEPNSFSQVMPFPVQSVTPGIVSSPLDINRPRLLNYTTHDWEVMPFPQQQLAPTNLFFQPHDWQKPRNTNFSDPQWQKLPPFPLAPLQIYTQPFETQKPRLSNWSDTQFGILPYPTPQIQIVTISSFATQDYPLPRLKNVSEVQFQINPFPQQQIAPTNLFFQPHDWQSPRVRNWTEPNSLSQIMPFPTPPFLAPTTVFLQPIYFLKPRLNNVSETFFNTMPFPTTEVSGTFVSSAQDSQFPRLFNLTEPNSFSNVPPFPTVEVTPVTNVYSPHDWQPAKYRNFADPLFALILPFPTPSVVAPINVFIQPFDTQRPRLISWSELFSQMQLVSQISPVPANAFTQTDFRIPSPLPRGLRSDLFSAGIAFGTPGSGGVTRIFSYISSSYIQ